MRLSNRSFPEETFRGRNLGRALIVVALTTSVAGCAGFLPLDAPDAAATKTNAALITSPSVPLPYALMPINPDVLRATNSITDDTGAAFSKLSGGNYRDVTIGVGDILTVTVYEAQAGGLFIPREAGVRPGNFVDIPRQQVDQSGNINIPYAGSIKVAGLTPRAVSNIIRDRLKDRAIDPQAVVAGRGTTRQSGQRAWRGQTHPSASRSIPAGSA